MGYLPALTIVADFYDSRLRWMIRHNKEDAFALESVVIGKRRDASRKLAQHAGKWRL
jgi:hypothetical protein